MANAVSSNVVLQFGLMTSTVSLFAAVEPRESNTTVCTGSNGLPAHDAAKLKQVMRCETCGDVPFTERKKAREVNGGLVLLTAQDLAEITVDAAEFKKKIAVRPHPASSVLETTTWGDKAYYLVPAAGQGETYAAIQHLVETHEELAFTAIWTARTVQSTFRLVIKDNVLMLRELVNGDRLRQAPEVTVPVLPPAYASMAEQLLALDGVVTEFDITEYADKGAEKLAVLLASRTPVAMQDTTAGSATPVAVPDAMAALQAMLTAAGAPAPKAPRKRAAKATV